MRALQTYPPAEIVGLRTDGLKVTQVRVRCAYCGSVHTHQWHDETDGLRAASCTPYGAVYRIRIATRERIAAMRADASFSTPSDVVGLVPLRVAFAFETDADEDVVGILVETALGKFVVWLPMDAAIGVAGALVDIAEDADGLRADYLEATKTALSAQRGATNAAGVV